MNKTILLLSLLTAFIIPSQIIAKNDVVPQVHRDIHRMLQQQMEDTQLFQAMVDSISSTQGLDTGFEPYPALDLYAEWSNDYVNPLIGKNITIPNSAEIDLKGFTAPIAGQINSPYGWRRRRMHKGQDIKLAVGDTVRAAFDGKVRMKRYERRGYGYYYVIRHSNGLETVYGHLSRQLVQEDEYVKAGQAIGLGGSTGRSTGPHLHFEMRYMGIALDPTELIDFGTYQPISPVYHFDRHKAEWTQNNKGKRGAKYSASSKSSSATASNKNTNASASSKTASSSGGSIHRVSKGDTLSGIARRYGTTVAKLCKLNNIKANKTLQLGEKIRYK